MTYSQEDDPRAVAKDIVLEVLLEHASRPGPAGEAARTDLRHLGEEYITRFHNLLSVLPELRKWIDSQNSRAKEQQKAFTTSFGAWGKSDETGAEYVDRIRGKVTPRNDDPQEKT